MHAGIYQIKNTRNGKLLIGASVSVDGRLAAHRYLLRLGKHTNLLLQIEWNRQGGEGFSFQVIERCPQEDLDRLEKHWVTELKPFGDRGYNQDLRAGRSGDKKVPLKLWLRPGTVDKLSTKAEKNKLSVSLLAEEILTAGLQEAEPRN